MICPRCERELVWQNDYDLGYDDDDRTYTDYVCLCGVFVTVPWEREDEQNEEEG